MPAEFVVDASGKNTRIPEFLERIGIGAPEVEQDIINCFYSTMQHRVPPERQWQDKVMVICYAYRPYEDTYAAQYYTDSSRTILSTSLVAYNCYSPPRTAQEFREFADLMPSPVVGENIDGLEPASPIYNFRYPNMLRLRYEKKRNLPRALLVVGDAYTSADPVSGLGMSLALKEVREMQLLLAKYGAGHQELPRRYYRKISRMADTAWFVIREQNLRFDWIKDVAEKRPFYFGALTWYMDRVIELVHDDLDTYREFLAVVHLVKPPAALMMPKVAGRVLGKWARTRLSGQKTLIARNYENRTVPAADHMIRTDEMAVGLAGTPHTLSSKQRGDQDGQIHRMLDCRGTRIHAVEEGEGPLVVLIHGFPESWYSWRHQLPALAAAGYRAVAIDQRGYGRSSKYRVQSAYRIKELVGDILGVIDAYGEKQAIVVGHDWGAPVAWTFAWLHPDRCAGVVGTQLSRSPGRV